MTDVATDKPRIQGFVSKEIFEAIEQYMAEENSSLSAAVSEAANAFFGLEKSTRDKIIKLAKEQKRQPGDQAAIILESAIKAMDS